MQENKWSKCLEDLRNEAIAEKSFKDFHAALVQVVSISYIVDGTTDIDVCQTFERKECGDDSWKTTQHNAIQGNRILERCKEREGDDINDDDNSNADEDDEDFVLTAAEDPGSSEDENWSFGRISSAVNLKRSRCRVTVGVPQLEYDHPVVAQFRKYCQDLRGGETKTIAKDVLAASRFAAWVLQGKESTASTALDRFTWALGSCEFSSFLGHVNEGYYGGTSNSRNLFSAIFKFLRFVKVMITTWTTDTSTVSLLRNSLDLFCDLLTDQLKAKKRYISSFSASATDALTVEELEGSEGSKPFYERCADAAENAISDFQEMYDRVVAVTDKERSAAITFIAGLMQVGQQPTRWCMLENGTVQEFTKTINKWKANGRTGGVYHTSAKHKTSQKYGDLTIYMENRTMRAIEMYQERFRVPHVGCQDGRDIFFTTNCGTKMPSSAWNKRLNRFVNKYLAMDKWVTVTLLRKKLETDGADMEARKTLSAAELQDLQRSDAHSSATATAWYNQRASLHAAMKGHEVFKKVAPEVCNELTKTDNNPKKRRLSDRLECKSDPKKTPVYIKRFFDNDMKSTKEEETLEYIANE